MVIVWQNELAAIKTVGFKTFEIFDEPLKPIRSQSFGRIVLIFWKREFKAI